MICFASPPQMPVTYRQTEILGHLVMVDNFTCSHADIGRFLGQSSWPCHTRGQRLQFGLGGRKQFLALEPTLLGQLGVVASIPFNMGNRQKHGLFEKNRGRELRKTEPDCKKPRKIGHSCMLRGLVLTTPEHGTPQGGVVTPPTMLQNPP